MKNLIKTFAVIALFVAFACSKSEQNVPLIGSIDQLILTSSSEDEVLAANEEVTFTIVGNDDVDYSTLAKLSINQEEVIGNSFVFTEEGIYEISASYLGTTSNTLTYNVVDSASFTIIINGTKFLRDQTAAFTLVNGEGEDITNEATFYIDDAAISGSQFSSSTEGIFEVYAEYTTAGETFSTEQKSFEVFIPKRKVVLEDYTGTWCGFCPRVAAAILAVHEVTDFVTIVAIHKTAANSPDPMHFQDFETLEDEYDVGGLPQARIDRSVVWVNPHPVSDVTAIAGTDTDAAISISSAINGSELSVTANVIYENGSTDGDKIVIYLLEDGILYDQTNYYDEDASSPYFGLGDPIPNFEHNEVLRDAMTATLGDAITVTGALETFTKNVSITIPSNYVAANLTIAVMLVDSNNTAYNSQHAHVGDFKDFE